MAQVNPVDLKTRVVLAEPEVAENPAEPAAQEERVEPAERKNPVDPVAMRHRPIPLPRSTGKRCLWSTTLITANTT